MTKPSTLQEQTDPDTEIAVLTADKAWTVADVRRLLPAVYAIIDGTPTLCTVAGRMCDFASVRAGSTIKIAEAEFAWSTIAAALNNGRPLRF